MVVNLNEEVARLLCFVAKFYVPVGNQHHPKDVFKCIYEKIIKKKICKTGFLSGLILEASMPLLCYYNVGKITDVNLLFSLYSGCSQRAPCILKQRSCGHAYSLFMVLLLEAWGASSEALPTSSVRLTLLWFNPGQQYKPRDAMVRRWHFPILFANNIFHHINHRVFSEWLCQTMFSLVWNILQQWESPGRKISQANNFLGMYKSAGIPIEFFFSQFHFS